MRLDANETLIRRHLIDHLQTVESKGSVFISELCIDAFSRRADLVVANGHLSVYEIKSNADDVSRLAGQLDTYRRFFESVTVVCAARHVSAVKRIASRPTGIYSINEDGTLVQVRSSGKVNRLTKKAWLSYLPVDMLASMLRAHQISAQGTRDILESRAVRYIRHPSIREFVLEYLKSTRWQRISKIKQRATVKYGSGLTQRERDAAAKELATALRDQVLIPIPRLKR